MFRREQPSVSVALLAVALVACGGRGGLPPEIPPVTKGRDGERVHVVRRGGYEAIYDGWGRLQRLQHDSNGDGRFDHVAHHGGARTPHLIEVDDDFDGQTDAWEEYDQQGGLLRTGTTRRGRVPDMWSYPAPGPRAVRQDYDENGDGRVDRTEFLLLGQIRRAEYDADGDGRTDRWQDWSGGRLVSEELDTDRDQQPDRRIRFGQGGRIVGTERLGHR